MEKDGSKTFLAFRLVFSHKPPERISAITDNDKRSPQPGNGVSTSTSNTIKRRPNRRRPVSRSPCRNLAVKLPNSLYFAHHALDKTKYFKRFSKPLIALNRPSLDKSMNFDRDDSEDAKSTMNERFDDGMDVQATIEDHGKTPRVEGGRPAMARKVSATLDTDDEIIVRMKQQRRTDKEIAKALVEAGGTKYNYKTIGSRWKRLRVALATARDRELDMGTVKWSQNDDFALLDAIRAADKDVFQMKLNAEDSKWDLVATHLREIKSDAIFSKKACFERAAGLRNGTAEIPPEIVAVDLAKREAKIAAAKKDHEKEMENLCHPKGLKAMVRESINDANEGRMDFLPHVSQHTRNESHESASGNQEGTPSRVDNVLYDADHESDVSEGIKPFTATTIDPKRLTANAPPALAPITSLSYEAQVVRAGNMNPGLDTSIPLKNVDDMTRDEMRDELRARGLAKRGVKESLKQTILAARAGVKGLKPSPRVVTPVIPRGLPRPLPYKRPDNHVPQYRHQATSVSSTAVYEPPSKKAKLMDFNPGTYAAASTSNTHLALVSNGLEYQNRAITGNTAPGPVGRFSLAACAGFLYKYVSDFDNLDPYQEPVSSGRRLFVYGFHESITIDNVNYLLRKYSVEAVYPLGLPGYFVADFAGVVNAVEATNALNGTMYSGRFIVMRNAYEVARSFDTGQTQQASIYTLPSQPTTLAREFGGNATNHRFRVTKVPTSVSPEDLMKVLVNAQACVPIGPGSFFINFFSTSSADMIKMGLQGIRICGQPIDFEVVEDEAPFIIR